LLLADIARQQAEFKRCSNAPLLSAFCAGLCFQRETSSCLGILALVVAATSGRSHRAGVVLGASAGLFWAASGTSIKALSDQLGDGAASVVLSPLAAVIALASFAGLVVSASSLQIGKAVPVIAVTSVARTCSRSRPARSSSASRSPTRRSAW